MSWREHSGKSEDHEQDSKDIEAHKVAGTTSTSNIPPTIRTFPGRIMYFSVLSGRKKCTSPDSSIPTQSNGMKDDFTVLIVSPPVRVSHGILLVFIQSVRNHLEIHAGLEVLLPPGTLGRGRESKDFHPGAGGRHAEFD